MGDPNHFLQFTFEQFGVWVVCVHTSTPPGVWVTTMLSHCLRHTVETQHVILDMATKFQTSTRWVVLGCAQKPNVAPHWVCTIVVQTYYNTSRKTDELRRQKIASDATTTSAFNNLWSVVLSRSRPTFTTQQAPVVRFASLVVCTSPLSFSLSLSWSEQDRKEYKNDTTVRVQSFERIRYRR